MFYVIVELYMGNISKENSKEAEKFYKLGTKNAELSNHEKAIEDFNKAIELNPEYAVAYYSRGISKGILREHEEAIEDFNKAIELNPEYAAAYGGRGVAKNYLGNYEEAIENFNKEIELNLEDADTYINRGFAKGMLGEYEEAIEDLNKAVELDPEDAGAYFNRGMAKNIIENYEEAIEDFDKAIELDPEGADTYNTQKQQVIKSIKLLDQVSEKIGKVSEKIDNVSEEIDNVSEEITISKHQKIFKDMQQQAKWVLIILGGVTVLLIIVFIGLSSFGLYLAHGSEDIDLKVYLPLYIFISSLIYIFINQTINVLKQWRIAENRIAMVDFLHQVREDKKMDSKIRIEMIKQIVPSIAHRIDDRGASNITNKFNAHGN